jgi:thioredoxin-dependent peroxiredoxin
MINEGERAPDFSLQADDGTTVKLSDLRGKTTILYFYPKADTTGCTIEACEFRDSYRGIGKSGAAVFGISPDPVKALVKFREKYELPFHLLSDQDHAVAERFGVWKEKSMYGRKYMGIERTTFVIDERGRISHIYRKVKPKGHAAEVLSELQGK